MGETVSDFEHDNQGVGCWLARKFLENIDRMASEETPISSADVFHAASHIAAHVLVMQDEQPLTDPDDGHTITDDERMAMFRKDVDALAQAARAILREMAAAQALATGAPKPSTQIN